MTSTASQSIPLPEEAAARPRGSSNSNFWSDLLGLSVSLRKKTRGEELQLLLLHDHTQEIPLCPWPLGVFGALAFAFRQGCGYSQLSSSAGQCLQPRPSPPFTKGNWFATLLSALNFASRVTPAKGSSSVVPEVCGDAHCFLLCKLLELLQPWWYKDACLWWGEQEEEGLLLY